MFVRADNVLSQVNLETVTPEEYLYDFTHNAAGPVFGCQKQHGQLSHVSQLLPEPLSCIYEDYCGNHLLSP